MKCPDSVFTGKTLSIVGFRFGITADDQSTAIAVMPTTPQFTREMIECMENSFGFGSFDLLGFSSYSKNLASDSKTVLETMKLSFDHHAVSDVVLFRHVDVVKPGELSRFRNASAEDIYHKEQLVKSREMILAANPQANVFMVYGRLVEDQTRIKFSDVLPSLEEQIRMYSPFRYRGIYQCDTAVLMCMDRKVRRETRHCVRYSLRHDKFVLIGLPGASRLLLEGDEAAWREVKRVFKYYGCKRLVIVHHSDCGKYGGLEHFNGDVIAEEMMHRAEMNALEKIIKQKFSGTEVVKVYTRLIDDAERLQFVQFD